MTLLDRLQTYLRESARQRYQAFPVPPFTVFVHPSSDFSYVNYAIPDQPTSGDLGGPLTALRATFLKHKRLPRFEFIQEFAPELAPALLEHGFEEESRTLFMTCSRENYRNAPAVPGLAITPLSAASSLADVRDFIMVQRHSFGSEEPPPVTETDVAEFLGTLATSPSFLARIDGQAAGVGSLTTPIDGLTEIVGVGTHPAFRRRGIAAAITAAALGSAFAQGVEIACLSAADVNAGRVYERVGFRPLATMLAYRASSA